MAHPQSVLIVGASRGIGLELVRQYRAAGAQVVATARDAAGLARLRELGAKALTLDVADAVSASGLAWQIDGEAFEVVVINAGVYGPRQDALSIPTQADFDHVMHTNVLGPMRVLPQVADSLAPRARLAIISSRMGSMGLRSNASGWLCRASQAAVNSVLKDASLVLQEKALCVALHPGWVRTDMGGPQADISPEDSATQLRANIAGLQAEHHGCLLDIDGRVLPW